MTKLLTTICLLISFQLNAQNLMPNNAKPAHIVKNLYAESGTGILWPNDPDIKSTFLSTRLSKIFTASLRKNGQFALSFDPVVNGQDALIRDVSIHPSILSSNKAQVIVNFRNFDTNNILVYGFVYEKSAWKLDEMASISGEFRWLLSNILENN